MAVRASARRPSRWASLSSRGVVSSTHTVPKAMPSSVTSGMPA
ncbi:hypothetical protein NB689_003561 [Xanthomonas sacchari]|nr:hypothetical protein [Xanthomonas sacchari]